MGKIKLAKHGYSGKSLPEKLGLKEEQRIFIFNAPGNIDRLIPLDDYNISTKLNGEFHTILFFSRAKKILEQKFLAFGEHLKSNGSLWVCWPKKTSTIITDLSENIIREVCLKKGMVDVKVCAIDKFWSGLKFVFRLKDR